MKRKNSIALEGQVILRVLCTDVYIGFLKQKKGIDSLATSQLLLLFLAYPMVVKMLFGGAMAVEPLAQSNLQRDPSSHFSTDNLRTSHPTSYL